jgi:hypothetical protein
MSADTMRALVVVAGLAAGVLWMSHSGGALDLNRMLGPALDTLGTWLKMVVERVAIAVLLVGALVVLSPKHQELGKRLAIGAVASLCLAEIGPPLLQWLQHLLTTSVRLLLHAA